MEIQRQPNGLLEINLDAVTLESQKQELALLPELLGNWQHKADSAKSCSIKLTCESKHAGELKPLVEDAVDTLNDGFDFSVKLKEIASRTEEIDPDFAQKKSHLKDLITLAIVDGQFDAEEQAVVFEVGEKMGFSKEQIDSVYNESVLIPEHIETINVADEDVRMQQLSNLCRLILADGKIDDWESVLIFPFAVRMGFEPADVSKMLQEMIDKEL